MRHKWNACTHINSSTSTHGSVTDFDAFKGRTVYV